MRCRMELVNKPFTIAEYNKYQFDRYLSMIKAIISVFEREQVSYTGKVSYTTYSLLEKLTLQLLDRAYGNNNS